MWSAIHGRGGIGYRLAQERVQHLTLQLPMLNCDASVSGFSPASSPTSEPTHRLLGALRLRAAG